MTQIQAVWHDIRGFMKRARKQVHLDVNLSAVLVCGMLILAIINLAAALACVLLILLILLAKAMHW